MAVVRYPFRVKHNGVYYAAGEEIETDTLEYDIAQGAEVVREDFVIKEAPAAPKKVGRPKKQ